MNTKNCFSSVGYGVILFFFSNLTIADPNTCIVSKVEAVRSKCKVGDILVFAPNTFGNEQYPILVAGSACDFSKPIVWNTGGVACVLDKPREITGQSHKNITKYLKVR